MWRGIGFAKNKRLREPLHINRLTINIVDLQMSIIVLEQ